MFVVHCRCQNFQASNSSFITKVFHSSIKYFYKNLVWNFVAMATERIYKLWPALLHRLLYRHELMTRFWIACYHGSLFKTLLTDWCIYGARPIQRQCFTPTGSKFFPLIVFSYYIGEKHVLKRVISLANWTPEFRLYQNLTQYTCKLKLVKTSLNVHGIVNSRLWKIISGFRAVYNFQGR